MPAEFYGSVRALFYQELADLKARTPFPFTHPDPAVPSPHPTPEFLPFFLAFWKQQVTLVVRGGGRVGMLALTLQLRLCLYLV